MHVSDDREPARIPGINSEPAGTAEQAANPQEAAAMSDLVEHGKLYIGGEWADPAGRDTIEVVSPHTEQVIGRVPHASRDDVDRAVAAPVRPSRPGCGRTPRWRTGSRW